MLLRATQRALRRGARQKSTVVMMRHGESTWNLENKFTGMKSGAEGKAAFFSGLASEAATPSRGSDAVEQSRVDGVSRAEVVPDAVESKHNLLFTQAGTTALYLRKVMKKPRRPAASWPRKGSSSTSRSPPL